MTVVQTALVLFAVCCCACNREKSPATDSTTFTLYRTSTVIPDARLHMATFDAVEGEAYNRGNCEIAQDLFNAQQGIKTRFFCEKGRYRK